LLAWAGTSELSAARTAREVSETPDRIPADFSFLLALDKFLAPGFRKGGAPARSEAEGKVFLQWTASVRNQKQFLKFVWREQGAAGLKSQIVLASEPRRLIASKL
jgi:hypothetical protein